MLKVWLLAGVVLGAVIAGSAQADGVDQLERLIKSGADSSSVSEGIVAADKGGDGIIRLTPDKTEIVRLEQDASSVVVTNPAHAAVMLDSPRLLVVMPRQPGATSFTVLNSRGETILEKSVIVSSAAQQKYVRVRKMCAGNDNSCVPSSYFYCPDGCYEVATVPPGEEGDVPEIAAHAAPPALPDEGIAGPEETAPVEQAEEPAVDETAEQSVEEQ